VLAHGGPSASVPRCRPGLPWPELVEGSPGAADGAPCGDRSSLRSVKYSVALFSAIEVIVVTHDDSRPASHRLTRDPRPSVTASALTTAVRCVARRFGGNVPDVGLGPARGASRVVGQGPRIGRSQRPVSALVVAGARG
jgi:hypothetical protein